MPEDPIDRAHVRYAIDHINKNIVTSFFKLMQAKDVGAQEKARTGTFLQFHSVLLLKSDRRFSVIQYRPGECLHSICS